MSTSICSTNYRTQSLTQCCSYICLYRFLDIFHAFFVLCSKFAANKTPEDGERNLCTFPRKDHDEISIYLTRLSVDIDKCLATLWSPESGKPKTFAALDFKEIEWLGVINGWIVERTQWCSSVWILYLYRKWSSWTTRWAPTRPTSYKCSYSPYK